MRGHKRSNCRKPAQYSGNYCGGHHSGNQHSGSRNIGGCIGGGQYSGGRHSGCNYGGHLYRGSHQGELKKEMLIVQKRPQLKEELPIYIQGKSEMCLSAKQNVIWVLDSGAIDNLVKDDSPVVNKYELSIPTKIHFTENNNNLLAWVI
jgi:hypothetical protein